MEQFICLRGDIFSHGLTPAALSVYTYIAMRQNRKSGAAYPSIATIAAACGMGATSVRKSLHLLVERGLLRVRAAGAVTKNGLYRQTANLYYLTVGVEEIFAAGREKGARDDEKQDAARKPQTVGERVTVTSTAASAAKRGKAAGSPMPLEGRESYFSHGSEDALSPEDENSKSGEAPTPSHHIYPENGAFFRASPHDAHPPRNLTGEIHKPKNKNNQSFCLPPLSPKGEGDGETRERAREFWGTRKDAEPDNARFEEELRTCYFHPSRLSAYRSDEQERLARSAMKRLWQSRGVMAKGEFIPRHEIRRLLMEECTPDILDLALSQLDEAHFVQSPVSYLAACLLDTVRHADVIFEKLSAKALWGTKSQKSENPTPWWG